MVVACFTPSRTLDAFRSPQEFVVLPLAVVGFQGVRVAMRLVGHCL